MTCKAVETGALWKPWKNGDIKQTTLGVEFFHRSHRFYDEIHPPKNETPRLQKCNLCAREKLLPMNRELQIGILCSVSIERDGVGVTSVNVGQSLSRRLVGLRALAQTAAGPGPRA